MIHALIISLKHKNNEININLYLIVFYEI